MRISQSCFIPSPLFSSATRNLPPPHFSLLSPSDVVISDDEPDDDTLMTAAEGITGGIRYGPAD